MLAAEVTSLASGLGCLLVNGPVVRRRQEPRRIWDAEEETLAFLFHRNEYKADALRQGTAMKLNDEGCDLIFRKARSHNGWRGEGVSDNELKELYELMKWGPTSANCSPARILFLRSQEAKERLKPALMPGNVEKSMTAPVVAILGYDLKFYDLLPKLFPVNPASREWFSGEDKKAFAETTAFRNGSLQGGYFIVAARAMGLDCGPMSGFDNAKVNAEFFKGTTVRSNFICALGHGDSGKLHARGPRLGFDDACKVL